MHAPIPAPAVLVGRDGELAILRAQLDAALAGQGSLVLIGGEAGIGKNHAHSFAGLRARLESKVTAHTLCIYINRLLGKADALQIKCLAFPN